MLVLVIDPSETIRRRLRELLTERCAVDVVEVGDAARAREVVSAGPIDVVLLDIAIGSPTTAHHEGMALLSELRELVPSALLIVLTNQSSGAYRQACMLYGAHHFFDKSREFEGAIEVVRKRATARSESKSTEPA